MVPVPRVVAVLTAAGSGSRLGDPRPKALVELDGVPLVRRAADALLASGTLDRLVVTAPASTVDAVVHALAGVSAPGARALPVDVVVGGASRQASVAAGVAQLVAAGEPDDAVVLVHDAARPLVPPAVVRRVVDAVAAGHPAVVPALPVTDTITEVDPEGTGHAVATLDRTRLRAVQTPQGFTLAVLRDAHEAAAHRAGDEATAATDDAGLAAARGVPVLVVEGHADALKITTRRDLAVAHVLLEER